MEWLKPALASTINKCFRQPASRYSGRRRAGRGRHPAYLQDSSELRVIMESQTNTTPRPLHPTSGPAYSARQAPTPRNSSTKYSQATKSYNPLNSTTQKKGTGCMHRMESQTTRHSESRGLVGKTTARVVKEGIRGRALG